MKNITKNPPEFCRLRNQIPVGLTRADRLELMPGTCVKERGSKIPMCGIVSKRSADSCVVIGHGWDNSDSETFIWRGNEDEFQTNWTID
jgi:hypothetical protein